MNIKLLTIAIAGALTTLPALAIELIGQVQSKNSQSVVAEVNGVVEHAHFEVGDSVKKESLLANVKAQNFRLEVAKQNANVELAAADLKLKSATYQRYQELSSNKNLSANDLDIAKAEYLSAKANLSIAKIELKVAQDELADTTITSSIHGFVVSKNAIQGAWVNQGDLLYSLVNIDTVTVQLLASEHDLTQLNVGQAIEIWAETTPMAKTVASISRIGVEMDSNTHAYPVEIDVSNTDLALKPGMSIYASTTLTANP